MFGAPTFWAARAALLLFLLFLVTGCHPASTWPDYIITEVFPAQVRDSDFKDVRASLDETIAWGITDSESGTVEVVDSGSDEHTLRLGIKVHLDFHPPEQESVTGDFCYESQSNAEAKIIDVKRALC